MRVCVCVYAAGRVLQLCDRVLLVLSRDHVNERAQRMHRSKDLFLVPRCGSLSLSLSRVERRKKEPTKKGKKNNQRRQTYLQQRATQPVKTANNNPRSQSSQGIGLARA